MKLFSDWRIVLVLVLTLGLAPYSPEPHIVGKIRWVAGGAVGMQPLDWLDFALHGIPWLLLIWVIIQKSVSRISSSDAKSVKEKK